MLHSIPLAECSHLAGVRDDASSLAHARVSSVPDCIISSTKSIYRLILFSSIFFQQHKRSNPLRYSKSVYDQFYSLVYRSVEPTVPNPETLGFKAVQAHRVRITATTLAVMAASNNDILLPVLAARAVPDPESQCCVLAVVLPAEIISDGNLSIRYTQDYIRSIDSIYISAARTRSMRVSTAQQSTAHL